MAVPVLAEALARWQHAAGPFWPYVCAAPFLEAGEGDALARELLANSPRDARRASDRQAGNPSSGRSERWPRRKTDLAERLLAAAAPAEVIGLPSLRRGDGTWGGQVIPASSNDLTVLLIDLPAEPILAVAPLLVERGWYVVPVVQRWIASPAVLPCRRLVERLVLGAWQARRPTTPRGAVLIADGERTGPAGYPALARGRAFDNRYEYQICRFPSMDFLRAHGVGRVDWISARAGGQITPDLAPYREDLLRAGIAVKVAPWVHLP